MRLNKAGKSKCGMSSSDCVLFVQSDIMPPTKWGIAGAGLISHDFVNAFSIRPPSEHIAVAVAARDLTRAKDFAEKHDISKAYDDYKSLAQDPEVDICYIGVTAPHHYHLVKMMLESGKHVLCEKPLGVNLSQVQEMLKLAQDKKLFLMEAIWSRCFPAYKRLRSILKNQVMGTPKHVITTFGLPAVDEEPRLNFKATGGGTVLDWGVYCIQVCLLAFGNQRPEKIKATALAINENGVDLGMNVNMHFPNGGFATFNTDLRVRMSNRCVIGGDKGTVTIAGPFWCPTTICTTSENDDWCEDFPIPTGAKHPFNFTNSGALVHEADHVGQCLKNGLLESPLVTHQDSLMIAEIQNEIMKQIGVCYD